MDVSDVVRVVVYGVPASILQYYQVEMHVMLSWRAFARRSSIIANTSVRCGEFMQEGH